MAFARDVYTATGGQTDFTISFPYLDDAHVTVSQNGTTLTEVTHYTFPNATTVRLVTGATAGDTIVLKRATSPGTRLVDYTAGVLVESDLDTDSLQGFYLAQESSDTADLALGLDNADNWDAENKRITNVAEPTALSDAVTKSYVDTRDGARYDSEEQTATASQTVFTLTSISYEPGVSNLSVYINGVRQAPSAYTETSGSVVTFTSGLTAGDLVQFVSSETTSSVVTNASNVTYNPSGTGSVQTNVQAKLRESVSVKDFGAVGDGVTDDTSAVQAALDNGGSIYFPSGTYLVVNLTVGPGVVLHGDGPTSSYLKLKNGASGAILSSSNATRLTLNNLGFDGNYTNCPAGTQCVEITGAESGGNGFWIDECGFFNAKSIGFYQTGTYTKVRIANCVVEGNQLDGIVFAADGIVTGNRCVTNGRFGILGTGSFAQIIGNTCDGNGQTTTGGAGIAVVGGDYAVASGNSCKSNGTGAYFTHGIQFNGVTNGVMEGNFSQGNNGSGLDMFQSPYTTCTGNQSLNNKVRGIENDTTSTYSTIDGNVVLGNEEVGISVFNTVGSVVSNNMVIGNGTLGTAVNPLTGVANAPYGIALWGAGSYGNSTMVLGNQISQNIGSGSNGVGMWVDASCVTVSLLGNQFSGNTTHLTAVKGNFKAVRDNQNVITEETGAVTLGGAATSVSVTFPQTLAFAPTPASIKLVPYNLPAVNIGPVAVTAVSATGFTFNTYAAPGGGGMTFDWAVSVFP